MAGGRVGSSLETSPAVTCMKIMLTVFNFNFWLSGIAILALGIWMKVQLHIYLELTQAYYDNTPYVLIGVGAGIVLIGSLGCMCTVKGKSSLLYVFAFFLILVFVAELSVAVAAFVFKGKFEGGFETGLTQALQVYKKGSDDPQTKAMDGLQAALHCCGKSNYTDWFGMAWDGTVASPSVPFSCCRDENKCANTGLPPVPTSPATDGIYTDGCYNKVTVFMKNNFMMIGGISVGFAFLQLFGAILACCLARNINKSKYEQVA